MIKSIQQLYKAPYNKRKPVEALVRFLIWKFIRVFKAKKIVYLIWEDRKVHLNYQSIQSAWLMYNCWVDWEEFNAIKDLVKDKDVFIDVGSNIGLYALWASKFTGPLGKVHCFEPDPNTFDSLSANIELNNLSEQIKLNKIGISNISGQLKFSVGRDIQNQLLDSAAPDYQLIPCISLDQYIEEHQIAKIRYLKIDIEGFEYQALLGAKLALEDAMIDIIQVEINEKITNAGIDYGSLTRMVEDYEYFLCEYDVEKRAFVKIDYSIGRENYFFVHRSFLSRLSDETP